MKVMKTVRNKPAQGNTGKLIALFLAVLFLWGCAGEKNDAVGDTLAGLHGLFGANRILATDGVIDGAGSSVCDWLTLTLKTAGAKDDYDAYLAALERYVTREYAENGRLDPNKPTEYYRIGLTVLALGGDPRAFGTHSDGTPVDLLNDGVWYYTGEGLYGQSVNAVAFALIFADAGGYSQPEDAVLTRTELVDMLLRQQTQEGAWGFANTPDADLTAMALQALAPYRNDPRTEAAVENALQWLSSAQSNTGAFTTNGAASSESVSQVILALCALGRDPATETQFIKPGGDLLSVLESFRLPDGCFAHTLAEDTGNAMATQQALLALCAVQRLRNAAKSIYDFT